MDGHRFRIFSIKYHPKYLNLFLSGGWDNTIQFWDTRQPHSIRFKIFQKLNEKVN